jgi:hypothetical protein
VGAQGDESSPDTSARILMDSVVPPDRRPMTVTHSLTMLVAAVAASLCWFSVAIAAPDEELLGKSKGYPMGTRANWYIDESVRVGSYSNLDKLFPN